MNALYIVQILCKSYLVTSESWIVMCGPGVDPGIITFNRGSVSELSSKGEGWWMACVEVDTGKRKVTISALGETLEIVSCFQCPLVPGGHVYEVFVCQPSNRQLLNAFLLIFSTTNELGATLGEFQFEHWPVNNRRNGRKEWRTQIHAIVAGYLDYLYLANAFPNHRLSKPKR